MGSFGRHAPTCPLHFHIFCFTWNFVSLANTLAALWSMEKTGYLKSSKIPHFQSGSTVKIYNMVRINNIVKYYDKYCKADIEAGPVQSQKRSFSDIN